MSNLIVNSQNKLYVINNKALEFKDYIQFQDPEVRRICVETWGDGNGLEKSQAAEVTSMPANYFGVYSGGTPIMSFDEFKYFGITVATSRCFQDNTALKSITLPSTLSSLSSYYFSGCTALEKITLSRSLNGGYSSAFANCSSLKRIDIPDISTWLGCTFTSGSYPSISSGELHLYINDVEVTQLVIPDGIQNIRNYLFTNCKGLTSVTLHSGIVSIGDSAFNGCTGLTGDITITSSIASVGSSAFRSCTGLEGTVVIQSGTTSVGHSVFRDCTGIKKVDLPANITLNQSCFQGCTSLEEITLRGSFTESNNYNFTGNTAVQILNISSVNDYASSTFTATGGSPTVATTYDVHVYDLLGNEITNVVIPSTVTGIANYEFRHWAFITSLTIPTSVTSIGQEAFRDCTALTGTVTIPSSVTSIGYAAFSGCTNLTSLNIPSSVTSIGDSAFSNCSGLEHFEISAQVNEFDVTKYCGGSGSGTLNSTLESYALGNTSTQSKMTLFMNYIFHGNFTPQSRPLKASNTDINKVVVDGDITTTNTNGGMLWGTTTPDFLEIGGTFSNSNNDINLIWYGATNNTKTCIVHLSYNGVAGKPSYLLFNRHPNMTVYVGEGTSQAGDQAVLDQYLADSDWSQYSAKLDLWSNYNGPYKA